MVLLSYHVNLREYVDPDQLYHVVPPVQPDQLQFLQVVWVRHHPAAVQLELDGQVLLPEDVQDRLPLDGADVGTGPAADGLQVVRLVEEGENT